MWTYKNFSGVACSLSFVLVFALLVLTKFSSAWAQNADPVGGDLSQQDFLVYCYALEGRNLMFQKASAEETMRNIQSLNRAARNNIEQSLNELISLKQRRIRYWLGRLQAIGVDPVSAPSLPRLDRLAREDMVATFPTPEQERCLKQCTFAGEKMKQNLDELFKTCSQQCFGKTVSPALQRARACNALTSHIK